MNNLKMSNIFTCGLKEKIKRKQEPAPKDLVEAVQNLRNFPSSGRICREAIKTAKRVLHDEVCPCFLTRRAVVVWQENTPEQFGVEYRKEKTIKMDNGYWLAHSYRFYPPHSKEDEICVNLEGSLTDKGFSPLKISEVEFLNSDRVLASYPVE
jgi:hypothetical protein